MTLGRPSAQKPKESGNKPVIISISGDLGSGKSLLANSLVERWEADRYSTGMVQRRLADRMGITTLELNKRAETDKAIDEQIDSVFKNLAKTPKNLVVDSRMAFHFLPMSFRIKLEVHPQVAASRIQGDTSRIGEGTYQTLADIEAAILARKSSERERFKLYYNADIEEHAGYDLVINTTDCNPQAVSQFANECVALWRKGIMPEKFWIAPKHLFPIIDPDTLDSVAVERDKINWPAIDQWTPGVIKAARVGSQYVVLSGAEWVSAGLRAGKALVPVTIVDEKADMPPAAITEKWEKSHNYKHLYVNTQ